MAILNRLYPSVALPGLLVPNVQQVPFKKYLGKESRMGNLGVEQAYLTMVSHINSETQIGQQWGSKMAKQSYALDQIALPYYRIEAYIEYNVDEQAKFEALSNGVALPDFLENLAKQGINQRRHQAIISGFDNTSGLGQGILANATANTMPADSNSRTTLVGYDPGELAQFLASIIRKAMDSTYGMAKPTVITSSARVINYLKSIIVPLGNSQQIGGGIDSAGGLLSRISNDWLGVGAVDFVEDNTLEGTGTDGADKIVFIAPGLDNQSQSDDENQNLVGQFNSINYNTMCDVAEGLMRFDAPPSMGTFGAKYTFKMTPGVTLRSEAVQVVEVKYA